MIHIGKPYLGEQEGRPALRAQVQIREKQEEIWFSVDPEYGEYLTDDRLDAFVVSLLPMAMRQGLDICCQAPITRRLHYQLTEYLIPGLAAGTPVFHSIALHAPVTDAVLPRGNGVGTGWSGGVDSMYTLMSHLQREEPQFRLTHLLIANIGTLESEDNRWMLAHMAEEARGGIAGELGLPVITLDSNVQLVLQETYLFGGTIMDNIRYGKLDATDDEVIAAAKAAGAHPFITRLRDGYRTEVADNGSNLSAGQRQMLALARAVLNDPPILILDEATSNVDTRTELRIQRILAGLMENRTSFVIAHRLGTIRDSDCIFVVDHGEIVERGNHAQLMAMDGTYARMYRSQYPEEA